MPEIERERTFPLTPEEFAEDKIIVSDVIMTDTSDTPLRLFDVPVQPQTPEASACCRLIRAILDGQRDQLISLPQYEALLCFVGAFKCNARKDRQPGGKHGNPKKSTCV